MLQQVQAISTATVSIFNRIFDEAVTLNSITHNTAYLTELELGGLRDRILNTDACWATAAPCSILNKDGLLDPVYHIADLASGMSTKITLDAYNADTVGPAIPG
jgi:hypothetical protein